MLEFHGENLPTGSLEKYGRWRIRGNYWFPDNCRNCSDIDFGWIGLISLAQDQWTVGPGLPRSEDLRRPQQILWGFQKNLEISIFAHCWPIKEVGVLFPNPCANSCCLVTAVISEPKMFSMMSYNPSKLAITHKEWSVWSEWHLPNKT